MLESMAGLVDGVRDALTSFVRPLTAAYYFVPSTESLRRCVDTAAPANGTER
jgi:putative iron-dependent peroxidase